MSLPISKIEEVPVFSSASSLKEYLKYYSCRLCSLGFQHGVNGCCVSRGDTSAAKMIVGIAPGKDENIGGRPFTGPAGKLLDELWKCVGMNTNDWLLTNTVLCRPIAPDGSGKENIDPDVEQRSKCKVYLDQHIQILKPKIIVALGRIPAESLLEVPNLKISECRGEFIRKRDYTVFTTYHPAYALHNKSDPAKYDAIRKIMWEDAKHLKEYIDERHW